MATKLKRRDAVKLGGYGLLGSALGGCEGQAGKAEMEVSDNTADLSHHLHDSGTVPVSASGWTRTLGEGPQYAALGEDIETDVLVVGAGLAGSSLALHLSEEGIAAVVIEARQPGWGASGRNAGHVLPLLKDVELISAFPDGGRAFFDLFREQHTIPFDIARRYGIECDASQSGYLTAMTSRRALEKFTHSSVLPAERLGQSMRPLEATAMREMTGSDYYRYGVLYESGGRINPYLLTQGMIAVACQNGARVFGESAATTISPHGKGWRVRTGNGATVSCRRVVFCTNAYSDEVVPAFQRGAYPLTAYALCSKPLPAALLDQVLPSRATLAQAPFDLNPFLIDGYNRIVTASLPSRSRPADAQWHFDQHLKWIHRTWPQTQGEPIELQAYWTGRVAMRQREFPGMYELDTGLYGLMHFNAWGNVMAPLMGMSLAKALASDRVDQLPFPVVKPDTITNPGKQELLIRSILIPAARFAQSLNII